MRSPRLLPVVLLASVALAGCGSSNLLDGSSAEDLQASIGRVEQAVDEGRCEQALSAATEGRQRVADLPSSVDRKLRSRLRQGFEELEQRIPSDCTERETTTTETTPTTTEEAPTTTETTPETTTETTPETTTTETTPTTTPETTTEDEVPLGDDGSGGIAPDDGEADDASDPATPRGLRELRDGVRELRDSGREARQQFEDAVRDVGKALRGDR